MIDNNIKEILSECFLQLMSTYKEGYKLSKLSPDDGGVDYRISYSRSIKINEINSLYDDEVQIDVQLKSTTEKGIKSKTGYIEYPLRVSNYNKLVYSRQKRKNIPCFLILFILPNKIEDRVVVLSNCIRLKKNAYWYIPEVNDEFSPNGKDSTVKIKIPAINKFSISTLEYLFKKYVPV
ncbi:MAG: DUF4365 domain-containing protein [Sphingobacteriales bacterium]|nr:MAG: DUF4365 domain-containing protein [Sphingobacteriales bacterium]